MIFDAGKPLDPRARLVTVAVALIICVSTPPDHFLAFAGYAALVVGALVAARASPRRVGNRLLLVVPFILVCAACLPFFGPGAATGGYSLGLGGLTVSPSGLLVLWNVTAKAFFGVLCVTALIETTPFPSVLRGLEQFRLPRLGLMLAGFAYRYVFVLTEEARRMKRARDARCYRGRWLWQAGVLGRMIGTLFVRSYERGERVYLAMMSRGFDGRFPSAAPTPLDIVDWAFMAGAIAAFLALRIGAV